MIKKQDAINTLYSNKFSISQSKIFQKHDSKMTFLYDQNHETFIIMKTYKEYSENIIIEDVLQLRVILREQKINIWNSYFLILLQNEKIEDKYYNIEKNSLGIRKYLVTKIEDLSRLPFIESNNGLKNIPLNLEDNISNVFQNIGGNAKSILDWLIENKGDIQDITRNELNEKINDIYRS